VGSGFSRIRQPLVPAARRLAQQTPRDGQRWLPESARRGTMNDYGFRLF